ncbi:MAG TPA: endo-1,4-beta-xylanase [Vicinamibacterales bacterium]|nr:endo-1,4-beta-xylanase [Vicinamibacterales bacterium]
MIPGRLAPVALAGILGAVLAAQAGCGGSKTAGSPTSPTTPTAPSGTPGMQAEPLRDAASASGKLVGAAIKSGLLGDANYAGVLRRHFNYLTAEFEMKWDAIERTRGSEDFRAGDTIVAFGLGNGMQVKGHALIWHGSVPGWLSALSPAEFRAAFEAHIRSVGEHFRGRVVAWDVVNEAIADDSAGLRDTVFRQKLGDQYIADAFRLARQADPQALLYYNDYGGEGLSGKSDRIYSLVQGLRAQGVPIDGVGLQMHVTATGAPSDASIAANIRRLTGLGLSVNISEMDVRIRDVPGTTPARLDVQKAVYKSIVGLCVAEPRCDGVTFWGFTDAYSWVDAQFGADDPLLFDEQYVVKPAYFGVLDALRRR